MSDLTKQQLEKRVIESNQIICEIALRMQCVVIAMHIANREQDIEKSRDTIADAIEEYIEDYLQCCGLLPSNDVRNVGDFFAQESKKNREDFKELLA
jgi:hypothetical protein